MPTRFHSFISHRSKSRTIQIATLVASISVVLALVALQSVRAVAPANEHFQRTWARTDKPIIDGLVSRTWNWGPEGISNELSEPYEDSPGGFRQVQYFDKSRMEINDPSGDPADLWYVTNGLLVVELMTGRMQTGDNDFEDRFPADIPVAGDPNDTEGVTYAVFADFRQVQPIALGTVYTQTLSNDGVVMNDPNLAGYNVSAAFLDDVTNHVIAEPFWNYMNSSGTVYVDGQFVDDLLFPNPFYSTGRPITEFYWVRSLVGGTARDVGIQCFERRCLTYTPGNPDGFIVEDGNVGLHYFVWRYETQQPTTTPTATVTSTETATATVTMTPTATSTSTATATSTPSPTVTTTPEEITVVVDASVDCDNDSLVDASAEAVGATGVCQGYLGGEIDTEINGSVGAVNEVQRLGPNNATGGTLTITFDHPLSLDNVVVTGVPHDATASEIQSEIDAGFSGIGYPGDAPIVTAISQDLDATLGEAAMRFTFSEGQLGGMDVPQMSVDSSLLTGSPTTVGTFSTLVEGQAAQNEVQQLLPNDAAGGTFTLQFDHPTEGLITTDPLPHNASAAFIEFELENAFDDAGVEEDTPTVVGGPANNAIVDFVFENGALEGQDVDQMTLDTSGLETVIQVSEVEVLDQGSMVLDTWQVDATGEAQGNLEPGTYEFCFTYSEGAGRIDTSCTGPVQVTTVNDTFTLIAHLEYNN